jgi:hypothetical protein
VWMVPFLPSSTTTHDVALVVWPGLAWPGGPIGRHISLQPRIRNGTPGKLLLYGVNLRLVPENLESATSTCTKTPGPWTLVPLIEKLPLLSTALPCPTPSFSSAHSIANKFKQTRDGKPIAFFILTCFILILRTDQHCTGGQSCPGAQGVLWL